MSLLQAGVIFCESLRVVVILGVGGVAVFVAYLLLMFVRDVVRQALRSWWAGWRWRRFVRSCHRAHDEYLRTGRLPGDKPRPVTDPIESAQRFHRDPDGEQ